MDKIKEIVARVMEVSPEQISPDFSRSRDEWDSFNHLSLISALEKELNITFTFEETEQIKSCEDIYKIVERKK